MGWRQLWYVSVLRYSSHSYDKIADESNVGAIEYIGSQIEANIPQPLE